MKLPYIEIGTEFNRLTVTGPPVKGKYGDFVYPCLCLCGVVTTATASRLYAKTKQSCGCYGRDLLVANVKTHGCTVGGQWTPEYRAWHHMMGRCCSETNKQYQDYGGRGIKVCDRWLDSFQNFLDDMGERPGRGWSLDRINVNGNYEPSNCRWATQTQQANNKRRTLYISGGGVIRTPSEWSSILGVTVPAILYRYKAGWSDEEILFGKTREKV